MMLEKVSTAFQEKFGETPLLFQAPGRVNLIGEHTDYNEGYVFPAAIDKGIVFGIRPSGNTICRLISLDLKDEYEFDITEISPSEKAWANYLLGVCAQLQAAGHSLEGFQCVFGGNIPVGAGLSSSAALECGLAYGLSQMFQFDIDRMKLAFLAQQAEHTYAGVQCGIMDQFASLFGKKGHAVRLDCRSMEYAYFPIDDSSYQFLLCDTKVSHSLASSEYNTRRQECEAGIHILQHHDPAIRSLRDATLDHLQQHKAEFDPVVYKRCEFVIQENSRVLEAGKRLEAGDMLSLGELMYQSHEGLQHKYEVSCRELDFLVETSRKIPEILGARMMGGGFGGCTINLIPRESAEKVSMQLRDAFVQEFGKEPGVYMALISEGVHQAG